MIMSFNLSIHFDKFSSNLFFNQKTYSDFSADLRSFSQRLKNLTEDSSIGICTKSPYLTMVALFGCFINGKTAILLSHLETESMIQKLKSQIHFDLIIRDFHFDHLKPLDQSQDYWPMDLDRPSLVVFSSGTTSLPKGVALSFNNLYYSALGFAEYFKQNEQETSLINLPHHHVGGLMVLWRAFFSGGRVSSNINDKIDYISLVPLQLKRMLEDNKKQQFLKKIKVILIGGAPLEQTLKEEASIYQLKLFETYGMSESASVVSINGEVLPYRKIKIDESGHINVGGKTLALGHYIDQKFSPIKDWLVTNDLGELFSETKIRFRGRTDLIINCAGEKINPFLIEETARLHPDINDALLVAVPDEFWGEVPVLLYEPTGESSQNTEELKKYFKAKLHPHHVPKFFFPILLNTEVQLKPKRHELKKIAYENVLKSIFSYDLLKHINPLAPVMVLFHGFLGNKDELSEALRPLSERYSLLSIDLPGHGETRVENFYGLHDLMTKLKHFIEIFSHSPIYYGYSMGGRVALQLSLSYLKPSKLWLESAGLGLINEEEKKTRLSADMSLFDDIGPSDNLQFLYKWYSQPMFKPYSMMNSFKKECERKSIHDSNEWKLSQKFLSVAHFPLQSTVIEQMRKCDFPVIYIYGEQDEKYKAMAHALVACGLKDLSLYEVKDAGHNPHKTHPAEITAMLINTFK